MKFLTRLLIYSSFIFYSCNETSEIGIDELLVNQKEKIKVHYTEIPLEVSNVYFDSVRTDDGDLYFGRNNDPVFGDIEAIGYSQFIYTEGLDIFDYIWKEKSLSKNVDELINIGIARLIDVANWACPLDASCMQHRNIIRNGAHGCHIMGDGHGRCPDIYHDFAD